MYLKRDTYGLFQRHAIEETPEQDDARERLRASELKFRLLDYIPQCPMQEKAGVIYTTYNDNAKPSEMRDRTTLQNWMNALAEQGLVQQGRFGWWSKADPKAKKD
jgi:hypothetical protein